MRQTFFHELEQIEQEEKKEEDRRRVEMFLRKKNGRTINEYLPFFIVVFIGIFSAIVTVYALYLFINVSRIGNVADVHVTKVLDLAFRSVFGDVYNNPELGIKNWEVYEGIGEGFEIRYPENWKLDKSSSHLFQIKKYNSQASINESLAAVAYVDRFENPKNLGLEDFISQNLAIDKSMFTRKNLNGNDLLKSVKLKDEAGLYYGIVSWERGGKVYLFKTIYYNQKNQVSEQEFDKMVLVMEINK